MPTFGTWERVVLEETYDDVDYISCHAYYEPKDGDYGSFLASAVDMDRFIDSVAATADHVKARAATATRRCTSRSTSGTSGTSPATRRWTRSPMSHDWPVAPRLLEDSYSVVDAVVFGNLLISLIRHADRVTSASLAQLVNVIAPIMTEPGGPRWRQTTFFPFAVTSELARGVALELKLDCPTYSLRALRRGADRRRRRDPRRRDRAHRRLPGEPEPRRGGDGGDRHERPRRRLDRIHSARSTTTTSTRVNTLTDQDRVSLRENDSRDGRTGLVCGHAAAGLMVGAHARMNEARSDVGTSVLQVRGTRIVAATPRRASRFRPRRVDEHGELHHRLPRHRVAAPTRPAAGARRGRIRRFFDRFLSVFFTDADAAFLRGSG